MENSYPEVFDISSDEEDNCEKPVDWLSDMLGQVNEDSDEVVVVGEVSGSSVCQQQSNYKWKGDSDDDDECLILDGDPDKPVEVEHDTGNESDELQVVGEKGQIACRDYPHPRHLCARYPFSSNPHEKYCDLCHCYVCDTQAPCKYWGTGGYTYDHCHSNDKEEVWKLLRKRFKEGKPAPVPATVPVPKVPVPPLVHNKPTHPHPVNNGAPNFIKYSLSKSTALRPCSSTQKYGVPNIIRNPHHQRPGSIKLPHHGVTRTVTAHPPSFKKVGPARYGPSSMNSTPVCNQLVSQQVRTQRSSQQPMGHGLMAPQSQYVVQPQVYSQPVPQAVQPTQQVYSQPMPQPVQTAQQVYSQPIPQPVQLPNTTYQPVNPVHCGLDDSLPDYDWFNNTTHSLPPPPPPPENPQFSNVQPTSSTVPPLVVQLSSVTQMPTSEPLPVTECVTTGLQCPAPTTILDSTEFELDSWMLGSGNEILSSDFSFIHTEMDAGLLTFDFENP